MGNCFGFRKTKVQSTTTVSGFTKASGNFHSSTPLNPKFSANAEKSVPGCLPTPRTEGDILSSPNIRPFALSELKNATMNFCPDRIIGEGGFGYIYKGWIDEQTLGAATPGNGLVVAVKRLKPEGSQGHREWLSEVNYLSQLHHPNLVKLIGYCLDQENQLLVYEFMPRGSLEDHLFGRGAPPLSWEMRIKVSIGAARGLSFLHDSESQVIYRDFKTSNILLDKEFNAKLSDFGLAKAGPTGDRTHVTTRVIGTQGYTAPEYIATGHLSTRCDVYSFGVVLLELLTGRQAVDKTKSGLEQNLVEWAKPYLGDRRKLFRVMDNRLQGQYSQKGAFMTALLALNCINEAKLRPRMAEVLDVLEDIAAAKPRSASHSVQNVDSQESSYPLRHSGHSPANMTPKGRPCHRMGTPNLQKIPLNDERFTSTFIM